MNYNFDFTFLLDFEQLPDTLESSWILGTPIAGIGTPHGISTSGTEMESNM